MFPWVFNMYVDTVMKEVKMRMEVRFLEEWREWKLPHLLYADDLVLCGELEGIPGFNGTGKKLPSCWFKINLTFCSFLAIYVRLGLIRLI